MSGLENYLALLARVDEICRRTSEAFSTHITCRAGCDACCRHLSIFAVEAAALRNALAELPAGQAELVRSKAREAREDSPCPLLHDGLCLLYQARPIICRTHGLPLLLLREGERTVDFCPENFQGIPSIPGSAVIDLERLNMMLATINALYLQAFPGPERLTIAQALTLTD
ncbi:YkgJ family cysteine cluster protein [Geomonas azotofigens]|uniref:YkgJ family cysteine cluster protein n=1 Tax=Geomonas azotofigens TaxID=2843196 RepID=UPI001C118DED|nr:YkgJ family cysteine cluster protein [Geomonas azotofigens]MBU5612796.1 YkgJ family cysteine cluster protein [Geomonas azotofigens]